MPLRAVIDGQSFYAWDLSENNRGSQFKCPECDDDFIIVLPKEDIIKHFRHKNNNSHGGESEKKEHREMKKYIMDCAKDIGLKCELEIRFTHEDTLHIADAVIYNDKEENKGYVFECQYSNISNEDYEERNKFYNEIGFIPVWILGGKKYDLSSPSNNRLEALIYKDIYICFYYKNKAIFYSSLPKYDSHIPVELELILKLMSPLLIEQRKIIIDEKERIIKLEWDKLNFENEERKRIYEENLKIEKELFELRHEERILLNKNDNYCEVCAASGNIRFGHRWLCWIHMREIIKEWYLAGHPNNWFWRPKGWNEGIYWII